MKSLANLLLCITFALIASIAFVGCGTTPHGPQTVHQRIETACISAGTAYGVIAEINKLKPLKASQQASVLKAKEKVDKQCKLAPGEDYPYSLSEALLSELEDASAAIKAVKGEVQ